MTCDEFMAERAKAADISLDDVLANVSIATFGAMDTHLMECERCRGVVLRNAAEAIRTLTPAQLVEARRRSDARLARDMADPEYTGPARMAPVTEDKPWGLG